MRDSIQSLCLIQWEIIRGWGLIEEETYLRRGLFKSGGLKLVVVATNLNPKLHNDIMT